MSNYKRTSTELVKVIARIRGREPLVIDCPEDGDENKCMEWLCNGSNDLKIHETLLSGFEWPSIVWIGEIGGVTPSQDLIMRAVSSLVVVYLQKDDYDKLYGIR